MTSADPRPDPFSRRREVAATSARSLLLTVLGEFVLPRGEPVWTQAVLDVLAGLGVEEKSARQALARTAADGLLDSERVGRRVRWSLSEPGRRLLTEGAARIYAHGLARPPWDGRWLVLVASLPEPRRDARSRLRTRLAWAGMGTPSPGLWVCPDPDRLDEVRTVIDEVGVAGSTYLFAGPYEGGVPREELVARAWDLATLDARYADFVDEVSHAEPVDDDEVLAAQVRLVDAWRRFPFLDPQLPDELLGEGWAGRRAAELFHTRHAEWLDTARQRFAEIARP